MIQHPSTVEFVIPAENAQTVVTLLLSNKITFTLNSSTYSQDSPQTTGSSSETEQDTKTDSTFVYVDPKEAAFESVCVKYLKSNIEQFPPKVDKIAAEVGISIASFKNGFKAAYGKTFYQLFMEKRIEYAKTLLLQGFKAVEISQRFGYSQHIKFNKVFQKYVGVTPKKYQESHNLKRKNQTGSL
jgi:AraC-like DNA-binding protein